MSDILLYTCPNCEASCSVALDLAGLNVVCPSCGQEFTATPPDLASDFQPPANVPFFKSGKLEILKNRLNKLTSDGELSKSDKIVLTRAALIMGLKEKVFWINKVIFLFFAYGDNFY
jgi:DNA-directed RNA polymerase subunit RPC12/RpoP